MSSRRKSIRVSITVPSGMHEEIKALADRVECSEAAAMRWLMFMGLEALQESKNPFKIKGKRSFKGNSDD